MSIQLVTNTNDNGLGSLRAAIAAAAPGDTIAFSPLLANQTITLTSGQITIPPGKSLIIDGSAAPNLAISGNNSSRIFYVQSTGVQPTTFTVQNLTLANAYTNGNGGAIYAEFRANTVINNVTFNAIAGFDTPGTVTLGGNLTGTGNLTHTGRSMLILGGDNSGYSGNIVVLPPSGDNTGRAVAVLSARSPNALGTGNLHLLGAVVQGLMPADATAVLEIGADLDGAAEMIARGERAAEEAMPAIREHHGESAA